MRQFDVISSRLSRFRASHMSMFFRTDSPVKFVDSIKYPKTLAVFRINEVKDFIELTLCRCAQEYHIFFRYASSLKINLTFNE